MTGIERDRDKFTVEYVCDCGEIPTYEIFRWKTGKDYCIDSCCGGGCVAAADIKFCPYCGSELKAR